MYLSGGLQSCRGLRGLGTGVGGAAVGTSVSAELSLTCPTSRSTAKFSLVPISELSEELWCIDTALDSLSRAEFTSAHGPFLIQRRFLL